MKHRKTHHAPQLNHTMEHDNAVCVCAYLQNLTKNTVFHINQFQFPSRMAQTNELLLMHFCGIKRCRMRMMRSNCLSLFLAQLQVSIRPAKIILALIQIYILFFISRFGLSVPHVQYILLSVLIGRHILLFHWIHYLSRQVG